MTIGAEMAEAGQGTNRAVLVRLLVVGLLWCTAGCTGDQAVTAEQAQATASQKYDFEYVKRQAKQLEAGLSKAEVLILLGSPAQREAARWIYLPSRSGLIVPAEAMVVRFVGGRYDSHSFEPIVLGERLGE